MQEPKPQAILPPKDNEPVLRVGIVLEEDQKQTVRFKIPEGEYTLCSDNQRVALSSNTEYTASNNQTEILVSDASNQPVIKSRTALKLLVASAPPVKAVSGIMFDSIVAGRGFHWEKVLPLTFSGSFEFIPKDASIILVNTVNFEDYLASVISSEMGSCCPVEFSKALAVASRSWATVFLGHKHPDAPFAICNDDDCQRYQGTTHLSQLAIDAVQACRGEFLTCPDETVCPGYYSKICGGFSEKAEHAFGFEVAGLAAVPDFPVQGSCTLNLGENLSDEANFTAWLNGGEESFCSAATVKEADYQQYLGAVDVSGTYFRWDYSISAKDLVRNLSNKFNLNDISQVTGFRLGPRGTSGRVLNLTVDYLTKAGTQQELYLENQYDIRRALHPSFLYSTAFIHTF
ncbi:SpoIID/LytB domain-containing protein, partial [Oligoflexia bacterium]|nr:SpoIID/LytB domain-containing protein [Oligoflexia bacterium]